MAILSGNYPITQRYGARSSVEKYSRGINYGTDIGVPAGQQVALPSGTWRVIESFSGATASGVGNVQRGINRGYGNSVLVENTSTGEKLRFSHLSRVANLKPGAVLRGGQVIGLSGATGNVVGKTGQHLDVEYRKAGNMLADILKSSYGNQLFGGGGGLVGQVQAAEKPAFDYNNPTHRQQLKDWRDSEISRYPKDADRIMDWYNEFLKDAETQSKQQTAKQYLEQTGELAPEEALNLGLSAEDIGKITPQGAKPAAKDVALANTGIERVKETAELFKQDPSVLTKQLIPGKFASRNFDKAMYDAVDSLLRLRTGAQANPSEIAGYMKRLGPYFGDSPEVVESKLNNLLEDFAQYAGTEPETISIIGEGMPSTEILPEATQAKTPPMLSNPLLQTILGKTPALSIAGALGASQIPIAGQIPGARGALAGAGWASGERGRQLVAGEAPSEAYQVGWQGRGLKPEERGGIATGALLDLLLSGTKKLVGPVKPSSIAAKRTALGEEAGEIDTKSLKAAGENYIKKINPTANKLWKEIKSTITNKMPANDLQDKLVDWGNLTYTTTGDVRAKAEAGLMNKLYGAGKQILKEQAPEMAKQSSKLRFLYQLPKNIQRYSWLALKGTAIGKMLGL